MAKCGALSLEELEKSETYDEINRLEQDVTNKPYQTLLSVIGITSSIGSIIMAATIIWNWNPMFVFFLIIISVGSTFLQMFVSKKNYTMKYKRSIQEREAWYYSYIQTHDTFFKELKQNNLPGYFLGKYKGILIAFIKQENRIERLKLGLEFVGLLFQEIVSATIIVICAHAAFNGEMLIGTMTAIIGATATLENASISAAGGTYMIYDSNIYMRLLRDFLNRPVERHCLKSVDHVHSIRLKNVSYEYIEGIPALSNVNIDLNRGKVVAVVGKNGSGKTTLFKVIAGLYTPTKGELLINGSNYIDIDPVSYRSVVSAMFQDYMKYEGSLRDNVAMSNINKKHDDLRIRKSLHYAKVEYQSMNISIDSFLGNWFHDGQELSGGQWQKIAVARAFFKDADLYLFDEPSSSIDAICEQQLFETILRICKNKIGLFITHKVHAAQMADLILVMDKGQIIDQGDHIYLYANCPIYKELYDKENP